MSESQPICSICNSEIAFQACTCGNRVKFLGLNCVIAHLQERMAHNIVSPSFGKRVLEDPSRLKTHIMDSPVIYDLINNLKNYENQVDRLTDQANIKIETLIKRLDSIFQAVLNRLSNVKIDISAIIQQLENYMCNLAEEGKTILNCYTKGGLDSIIHDYVQDIDIDIEDSLRYFESKIRVISSNFNLQDEVLRNDEVSSSLSSTDESSRAIGPHSTDEDESIEAMRLALVKSQEDLSYLSQLLNQKTSEIAEYQKQIYEKNMIIDRCTSLNKQMEHQIADFNSQQMTDQPRKKIKFEISPEEETLKCNEANTLIADLKKELKVLRSNKTKNENKIKKLEAQVKEITPELKPLQNFKRIQDHLNGITSNQEPSMEICEGYNRFMYIPQYCTKRLLRIDVISCKVQALTFSNMGRVFSDTSICLLENGDIICAGFTNPISSDAYLLKLDTQECIKLPDLSSPRYYLSLYYYRGYVYAFGGLDPQHQLDYTAERLNLSDYSWEKLPNMMQGGDCLSCVGIGSTIYIFSGSKKVIDTFNIESLTFKNFELHNSEPRTCPGIAFLHQDKVYLLTSTFKQIYDLKLKKIQHFQYTSRAQKSSIHSLARIKDCIYFFNTSTFLLEKFSTSYEDPSPAHINPSPKYIYTTLIKSTNLTRINLQDSKMKAIDVSKSLKRDFYYTSKCVLPNGDVFIAGFTNPLENNCYIFETKSNTCTRVEDIPTARYYISLFYYRGYVYAFGGQTDEINSVNTAERFELDSMRWSGLSNMIRKRNSASCVGIDDKIYIFGGNHMCVEVYDINRDVFELKEVYLYNDAVAVYTHDLIFVIGGQDYTILSRDLEILEETSYDTTNKHNPYSPSNVEICNGNIYFYNDRTCMLEYFNIQTRKRGINIINNT